MPHRRSCAVGLAAILVLVLTGLLASQSVAQEERPPVPLDAADVARLGGDLPGDPQVQLVQVASGLTNPVNIAFPPDDSGRLFVIEVGGTIRVVNPDGTLVEDPFLDLSATVALRPGQQGLLGLAFHPEFGQNGRLYVAYNNLYKNGALTISEFLVSEDDANVGDVKTERPLLVIDKPYPQHDGGTLRFGPDGMLYISTGDGGWQGDPYDNAQSRFSLLGKILRIDVDGTADGRPYGIPADNPNAGPGRYDNPYPGQQPVAEGEERRRTKDDPGGVSAENRKNRPPVRQEIWALGFRNPWQFAFDPATGDFYVGDVGADSWEEINFQPADLPAGQNYGWDWLEASHCFPAGLDECPRQQVGQLPIAEYAHGNDGCAVIGIGVYRGEEFPSLDGIYFNAEYCTGEIRGLQRDDSGAWQFESLLDTALQLTGAAQDANGDLFVTGLTGRGEGEGNGTVWRIVDANAVPEGAVTVPLGDPSGGAIEVDEEGEPIPAADEATVAATPVAEAAPGAAAATPAAAGDAADLPEFVIGMEDIFFAPERVEIPANTDVRLIFENNGAVIHNFEIKGTDISVDVEPGETGEAIVNLAEGRHKFICNIPGHNQAGMNGLVIVK
jgi:glucose/arabinose dehydrogenase/plastocyanin